MNQSAKALIQFLLAFALALGGVAFLAREPIARFFQVNRAHYYANQGHEREDSTLEERDEAWGRALEILEGLEPEGGRAAAIARLKMDAHLNLGDSHQALTVWESHTGERADESDEEPMEPLYGFALLFDSQPQRAADYFGRWDDPYSEALGAFLSNPSPANYAEMKSAIRARYPRRPLYVQGVIDWLGARLNSAQGEFDQALRTLRSVVEEYPGHAAFYFDYGLASMAEGQTDLACSYMLTAFRIVEERYPGEAAIRVKASWNTMISRRIMLLIYAAQNQMALRMIRGLGGAVELDLGKHLSAILVQPYLSPATVFELHALFKRRPLSWPVRRREFRALSDFDQAFDWVFSDDLAGARLDRIPKPESVLAIRRLRGMRVENLSTGTTPWKIRVLPGGPDVGARVLLLKMRGTFRRGIGAGFSISVGWRTETDYIGLGESWHAFDVPRTIGDDTILVSLQMTNAFLEGVDDDEQDKSRRSLTILDALLVDVRP